MKKAKAYQLEPDGPSETISPAHLVEADLQVAETKLSRLLDSNESIIAEICHYLVDAGGKRFRPLVTLLASHFGDPTAAEIVPVGSVDGHHYQAGPVARTLMADFQQLVREPACEGFGESTHLAPDRSTLAA